MNYKISALPVLSYNVSLQGNVWVNLSPGDNVVNIISANYYIDIKIPALFI